MNRTLFDCGIKKSVELKDGRLYDITETLGKSVELSSKSLKCNICEKSFTGEQYLNIHVRLKHEIQSAAAAGNTHRSLSQGPSGVLQTDSLENLDNRQSESDKEFNINGQSGQGQRPQQQEKRRGSAKRNSYTLDFKIKTLNRLDQIKTKGKVGKFLAVAKERGVSKSLVIKWNKEKDRLQEQLVLNKYRKNTGPTTAARRRRRITDNRSKHMEKYPRASKLLVSEFKLRRAAGSKVSKLWIKKTMKAKIEMCYGKEAAERFKGSHNWFQRFKKRHGIVLRRRTNKKKDSADDGRSTIQKFHRNLRKSLKTQRRRNRSSIDPKYGRWLPKNRYNIDQVPLAFVTGQETTYDTLGSKQVWVSQPSSGLDKRQATLQLCIRAEGEQNVKPAIVFRGKGNLSIFEKEQYDKGVDVFYQPSAWMDTEVNMQWVKQTLVPGIGKDKDDKVIFVDNVGFQQSKTFHQVCRNEINASVYMLPENHTDKIQPVDAGCGKMMKVKIAAEMERWLEEEQNLEKWHDKLSARERRILMTKWTAEAWRELSKNKEFFRRLFEKTGCLLTADGSNDDKICPQGLDNYQF
ncbi:tigger transposable element-derived protein 2-like [Dendronephthya gigantea]|uniref:tigger transposable element-derived protein 2-like n=1 Tax=Dendronephthya gigantea TaxID=151771 RepID=UPI00106BD373|nr:tigger transposable element-derived protein 2-like [Dendronephthya gigantea]XP_028415539.1 tigger transposable element-derived protein 2-like [Dendronephthya gigantea]